MAKNALAKADPRDIDVGLLRMTTRGVQVLGKFSDTQWENAVSLLDHASQSVNWCIGDLLLLGESAFGEEWAQQKIDEYAPAVSPATKKDCRWVSERFPAADRIRPLPWTHYRVVAGVDDVKTRQELLKAASEKNWTQSDLRRAVRDTKGAASPKTMPNTLSAFLADVREELESISLKDTSVNGELYDSQFLLLPAADAAITAINVAAKDGVQPARDALVKLAACAVFAGQKAS